MMSIEEQIAVLETKLDYIRVLNHTRDLCKKRGFVSDAHSHVIHDCVNQIDRLTHCRSFPYEVYSSMQDDIDVHRVVTFMVRARLYSVKTALRSRT